MNDCMLAPCAYATVLDDEWWCRLQIGTAEAQRAHKLYRDPRIEEEPGATRLRSLYSTLDRFVVSVIFGLLCRSNVMI